MQSTATAYIVKDGKYIPYNVVITDYYGQLYKKSYYAGEAFQYERNPDYIYYFSDENGQNEISKFGEDLNGGKIELDKNFHSNSLIKFLPYVAILAASFLLIKIKRK